MPFNGPRQAKRAEYGDHRLSDKEDKSKSRNADIETEQAPGTDTREDGIPPEYSEQTPESRDSNNTKTFKNQVVSQASRYLLAVLRFFTICHIIFGIVEILFKYDTLLIQGTEGGLEQLPWGFAPFFLVIYALALWKIYYHYTCNFFLRILVLVVDISLLGTSRELPIHFLGMLVTLVFYWFHPDV